MECMQSTGSVAVQSAVENRVSPYLEFQILVNFVSKGANLSLQLRDIDAE